MRSEPGANWPNSKRLEGVWESKGLGVVHHPTTRNNHNQPDVGKGSRACSMGIFSREEKKKKKIWRFSRSDKTIWIWNSMKNQLFINFHPRNHLLGFHPSCSQTVKPFNWMGMIHSATEISFDGNPSKMASHSMAYLTPFWSDFPLMEI